MKLVAVKAIIVTILMFAALFLGFFWFNEEIMAELGNWAENPLGHHYTGALFFSLGMGGLMYTIIKWKHGWGSMPLMTIWFLATFVGLFMFLFAILPSGVAAHEHFSSNIMDAFETGDIKEALEVFATMLLLPMAFLFFALGGVRILVQAPLEKGLKEASTVKHRSTQRKQAVQYKHSKKNMQSKLGRK